jgi:hypothetical protein
MSLIITLHGQEGIVMASDSRLTLNNTETAGTQTTVTVGVSQTDTNYKTFLGKGRIGISTFGAAMIQGVPISGYIESFLNENIADDTDIDTVPQLLVQYFQSTPAVPDAGFQVAGYKKVGNQTQQKIWRCFAANQTVQEVVPATQTIGAVWNGEQDVLTRILNQQIYISDGAGGYTLMPSFGVPFHTFTLQDMIGFAVYAIRATADTMRFQLRAKTVGGPSDVLLIKPTEAIWISRKGLSLRDDQN